MNERVLLSIKDLVVKFRVRGRVLTAIRGVSLDVYENETLAIVGESGCGKSVLTKTFSGTLDNNGFIAEGEIVFHDPELSRTRARINPASASLMTWAEGRLNALSKLELGAATFREMAALKKSRQEQTALGAEELASFESERAALVYARAEAGNRKQTLTGADERTQKRETARTVADLDMRIKQLYARQRQAARDRARTVRGDTAYLNGYRDKMRALKTRYDAECAGPVSPDTRERNRLLAKEIYLSISRYPARKRAGLLRPLFKAIRKACEMGADLRDETQLNKIFETVLFRVRYERETEKHIYGVSVLNLAQSHCVGDWTAIRGNKIAIIFQDPMTSLNPILTIGSQIASVITKHQHVSETEARKRAIVLMKRVGIPDAQNRYDDYPFQYSGGMRQRIVIAIALSCQPKILICDEPTTALDVTIQAQILRLIKDLQREFGFTAVFITHDLGIVANVADRVAVLYAGQIVEIGTAEEIFYDPRHPYTWVLLSSLPQLSDRNSELYSIAGTPPSLYNRVAGDAFAPRNPFCLKIDTVMEPPMFRVTDTHFAKTWLLDLRAPKVAKPAVIGDINGTLRRVFNI